MIREEAAAPPPIRGQAFRTFALLAGAFAVVSASAIVFLFDPATHNFYPFCYFNFLTGLNCPGCGAMRALHQLLHGNVAAAAKLNLLLLVCLPPMAWLVGRYFVARLRGRQALLTIPPSWLWTFLVFSTVFTVLRNLPGFAWLAP